MPGLLGLTTTVVAWILLTIVVVGWLGRLGWTVDRVRSLGSALEDLVDRVRQA